MYMLQGERSWIHYVLQGDRKCKEREVGYTMCCRETGSARRENLYTLCAAGRQEVQGQKYKP